MSDEVTGDVTGGTGAQDSAELQRLEHISEVLDMVYLDAQGETGGASDAAAVYEVDTAQWQDLLTRLDTMHEVMSLTLYLTLLLLCGVGAVLGGHLWRSFSEGFRR